MTITRDPDYPVDAAHLMAAFNRCADGYDARAVLEASANMLIAVIANLSPNRAAATALSEIVFKGIGRGITANFNRAPQSTDIKVGTQ